MREHRFAEARELAAQMESAAPGSREILYWRAFAERHLRRTDDALATLERLARHHPGYARLHEERGHCYVARRDGARAIAAYETALGLNPALPGVWSTLSGLYGMAGDHENMRRAAREAAALRALPPEVLRANALFADGETAAAEQLVRAYLLQHGDQVEAMRLLARIGARLEVYDDAELLLRGVLELAPEHHAARQELASVLLERHKDQEARTQIERLLASFPGRRDLRILEALAAVGLGEHLRAIELYRALLADAPALPRARAELHLSIAHSCKTVGRSEQAIEAYRAAAAECPDFGDAYWSLANLKTYRFSAAELAQMRAAEQSPDTGPLDRYHLCFALGKACEDRGEYADSWQYYQRGNAQKRAASRYRPEIIERNTANQQRVVTREFIAARRGAGVASNAPILVLGLPRSGSTLIEQILASHPQVEGTHELAEIPRTVLELQGREPDLDNPRYPAVLAELPLERFAQLGQKYLDDTAYYRSGKPRFIDKMPNNFRHIGLIHLMLPNARVIDIRREPMACCFGNLKQLFARGQEFTYSIEDIARYYRTYLELMDHWDQVLPGRVLRVHYEDVVGDLEGSVRRLLEYCELPFDPACLEFHRTERSVRTASSEQVRQPIFREGLEQWRHYEPWLEPLRAALGDALERYR
ncbi:MAG: sulfotransferase [Gammaproteobacteria bacterium]|nr:sulfotransferase [Gammaproteobacteria bacterium]MDE2250523.1 sulfotransferase [Gammaproteobacteria bacterium]